jgi:CDP-diacylglycerol--glycerol-3-phosphate 3-phosphatidyltransferase
VIKARLGDRLDGWIHALLPFLFVRPVNPNALTVAGSAISLCAAFAYARGSFLLGGVLLLAGGFFDLVDGVVARHFGRSTAFGAFLDSTLDRFVDMVVLLGLILHYAPAGRQGAVLLVGVALSMSVLTSYTKARAEQVIPHLEGGFVERGERVALLAAGSLTGWMLPALWLLALGTTLTVVQRFAAAHRQLKDKPLETVKEREEER